MGNQNEGWLKHAIATSEANARRILIETHLPKSMELNKSPVMTSELAKGLEGRNKSQDS